LKGVENVKHTFKPDRINGSEGIAVEVGYDFQNSGALKPL
jgi:hypothetical protein